MTENKFVELKKLNVNEHTEKKGNLTYLSWAWAWGIFQEHYPDADYEVREYDNKLYFKDESGCHVYTYITAGGKKKPMWLPIMDYKNNAVKTPTSTDVNKAVMRCLTKNMAMFGLGLYIYAGEDLPEGEEQEKPHTGRQMDDPHVLAEFKSRGVDFDQQEKDLIAEIRQYAVMENLEKWGVENKDKIKSLPTVNQDRVRKAYKDRQAMIESNDRGFQ